MTKERAMAAILTARDLQHWKHLCPYGRWRCADGREVLFNRSYWPILERPPPEPAKAAHPGEWIEGIVHQHYFFDDFGSPWRRPDGPEAWRSLARINRTLKEPGDCRASATRRRPKKTVRRSASSRPTTDPYPHGTTLGDTCSAQPARNHSETAKSARPRDSPQPPATIAQPFSIAATPQPCATSPQPLCNCDATIAQPSRRP
jgi:hypothetical protein